MAYNVSNTAGPWPEVGSGLNVTTPITTGCWATSGIVVDNALTTATGNSQLYFIGLGTNAAGGAQPALPDKPALRARRVPQLRSGLRRRRR